jgi:hypothetical protein
MRCPFLSMHMALDVSRASSGIAILFYFLHYNIQCLDSNKIQWQRLGKMLHCRRRCNTPSTKAPVNKTI